MTDDRLRAEPLQPRRPRAEHVLDRCTERGHRLHPVVPVAHRRRPAGGPLDRGGKHHGATPSQLALAWLLHRSPVMLPIPGTSSVAHLEENVAAAAIELSPDDIAALTPKG